VLLAAALYTAFAQEDLMVMLGGLAVSYGFMLYPALLVTCYGFRGWPMKRDCSCCTIRQSTLLAMVSTS
jgi:solute:Na+ symporter, SSS family